MSTKSVNRVKKIIFIVIMTFVFSYSLQAQPKRSSTGIGFRFSFWNMGNESNFLTYRERAGREHIETSGAGGWISFFSRTSDNWVFELSVGAFGKVNSEYADFNDDEDVTAVIPILLGMQRDFLNINNSSALRPYISFGGGPYWITNVRENNFVDEEVISSIDPGAYFGGGLNFLFSQKFALNFDLKYHFVNFKVAKDLSGPEFGVGFSFMWGEKREFVRILGVKPIVNDIYPAYYQFYNLYPLVMVTVRNLTSSPIEVNIRSNIRYFSERPKETGYITVAGKETKDIPITAILGSRIRTVKQRETAVLDLVVEARAGTKITKQLSSSIMVHNPNSWNGEMDKLVFFVTPDHDQILDFSRSVTNQLAVESDSELRDFHIAKHMFEEIGKLGLRYHSDPNIPFYQDDRVQFANETLNIKSGDCDDLVVLYASLLESVGINTAFVEVQDPEKELAHLYLMFNSGVPVEQGNLISSNEKRYLSRDNSIGQKTVWIPVETTLISDSFEEAWKVGALAYLQEGEFRGGIAKGWVRVIDVE